MKALIFIILLCVSVASNANSWKYERFQLYPVKMYQDEWPRTSYNFKKLDFKKISGARLASLSYAAGRCMALLNAEELARKRKSSLLKGFMYDFKSDEIYYFNSSVIYNNCELINYQFYRYISKEVDKLKRLENQ